MHVHTVLVKLTDPSTLETCRAAMESMRGRLDSLVQLDVHTNNLAGSYSCDLALTTVWPDVAAYRAYERDPVHLEVREVVLGLMADAMTIDYALEAP